MSYDDDVPSYGQKFIVVVVVFGFFYCIILVYAFLFCFLFSWFMGDGFVVYLE